MQQHSQPVVKLGLNQTSAVESHSIWLLMNPTHSQCISGLGNEMKVTGRDFRGPQSGSRTSLETFRGD